MNAANKPQPGARFPVWLKTIWVLSALALVFFYFYDLMGDRATSNVLMILLVGLVLGLTWLVFLLDRRRSAKVRRLVLLLCGAALALFLTLFRFSGMSGALIPEVEWRFAANQWDALAPPAPGERPVDLNRAQAFDFPGFLGANRNARIDTVVLETDPSKAEPELLFKQPIGAGQSGFAVVNGFAATLEQRDTEELATLYEVDSGTLVWSHVLDRGAGFGDKVVGLGPRSTPTIAGGTVYVQSVRGQLVALEGASGNELWRVDLLEIGGISQEQESSQMPYGRSGSPLVVGHRVIAAVGGSAAGSGISAAAFDRHTGELLWKGGRHHLSMSSPALGTYGGVDQVLLVNQDFASGLDLETGEQLWEIPWPGKTASNANVSQPVPVPDDRLFLSKGYGQGAALYEIKKTASGTWQPTLIWESRRSLKTKFTNVAIKGNWVYGLSEGILECVNLETGERAWKGGRYGHGQLLLVGDVLVVLTENGQVVYVADNPEERNQVLYEFDALSGRTWNNFALAGDRLLVRNAREFAVYRVPLR